MVRQRIIFGLLMGSTFVALLLADAWLDASGFLPGRAGGLLLTTLVLVLCVLASRELFNMALAKGLRPLYLSGAVASSALAVSPFFAAMHPGLRQLPLVVLAVGVMLIFAAQAAARRKTDAIPNIAATLLAVGYLGGLGLFITLIRIEFGTWGLVIYLVAVKFTDIGAWLAGMAVGRHKLIPWLSPGKSWEGLFGGIFVAAIASVATAMLAAAAGQPVLGWWQAIVFGLALAPAGQCGDLAESLLKRDAGVKDSGQTIPGFGGLLDVLDSPLGAAPLGYVLLLLLASA